MSTRWILWKFTAAALLCSPAWVQASVVMLDPYLPASTPTATGASATFIRIDNGWHDSSVLYDDQTSQFGTGPAIGTYESWGSGIWGIADFNTVLGGGVAPVDSWTGGISTINFGDGCYNQEYSGTWGAATLVPMFSPGVGCESTDPQSAGANEQDNWISYFTGYIRITDPGDYNFSVLVDDGFFFTLYGAGGTSQSISLDYLNPRIRTCYGSVDPAACTGDYFSLTEGLYRFELGAYDRLQAGVVDLRWLHGSETEWTLVPTENLASVPEPATIALFATGLAGLLLSRRRHGRWAGAACHPHGS